MSSRYDPVDDTEPPAPRAPLEPSPPRFRRPPWGAIVALLLTAAVGVSAAFGFDLCAFLQGVGVSLDSCGAPAAAPSAPEPGKP